MPAVIASVAVTVSAVKSAQLFITLYKICQFVGLKKKEVTTIVCVFLRKAPTKKLNIFQFRSFYENFVEVSNVFIIGMFKRVNKKREN